MKNIARTVALVVALATGGGAVAARDAEACGGYVTITEGERVQWALQAFLGELGTRVSYGAASVKEGKTAQVVIQMDAAAGKRRAKAQQTFFLEKRDGEWKVVDWSFPVAAPVPAKVART